MEKRSKWSIGLLTFMAVVMISIGWYSEVLFYFYRLNGDGLDIIPSIGIGAGLTLLLTFFFIDTNWLKAVGIVILLSTSIFFTVAGQNYFYTEKHNVGNKQTATEENKQVLFDEYTKNIEKLKKDILIKENIVPTDLVKLAEWKTNAVNPLREDIAILKAEKLLYEGKRDSIVLVNSNSIKIESLTAYEALAKDLGLSSFTPLKLVSQALLSLFIALMAPSGIRLLTSIWGTDKPKEIDKPKKEISNATDKPLLFTNSLYRDDENPSTLKSRTDVVEETGLSYGYFNKARALALELGLIRKMANNITVPVATKTEFLLHMKTKQPYNGSIRAVR